MFIHWNLSLSLSLRLVHHLSLRLSLTLCLLIAYACAPYKERAAGVQNRILVFSSQQDLPSIGPAIEKVFDRVIYTPEPELYFEVEFKDPSDFENLKHYHNVVVVSLISPHDTTGDPLAKSLLPEGQYQSAVLGENSVFSTQDVFSRGQQLVILIARTKDDLERSLVKKGAWVYDQFDKAFLSRMKDHVFKTMEQKKLSREFESKYGWNMRLQHDYAIIQEKPEKKFVWLGRSFPYRWITIRWIENPPTTELDSQIATEIIRALPEIFLKDVRFSSHYQRIDRIDLNKRRAWRLEGLWEHKTDTKGGPFISYLFYDPPSDRIFNINCLIHYPGGKKVILLRQMETMVHTFSS